VISSFYDYAGTPGLISVLGWMIALALGAAYLIRLRSPIVSRAVVVLAVTAFVCARLASTTISEIETIPTPPPNDAEKAKALENMQKRAVNVRFAEDSSTDRLDIGGASTHELKAAGVEVAPPAADNYDFRSKGKQQRDAGMSKGISIEGATPTTAPSEEAPPVKAARALPEPDVLRANRLDDVNLFMARVTLIIAVILLLGDYLRRFNQTFARVFPLPLAGRLIDSLFGKAHAVHVTRKAGGGERAIQKFLETALLKGESFIYMGPSDPWAKERDLPRLLVRKKRVRIDKLVCDAASTPEFRAFAFEAAWHGQGCVVVTGDEAAQAMAMLIVEGLGEGKRNVEPTSRTVNVVWEFDAPPADELLERLARACTQGNFRLLVVSPATPPAKAAREVYAEVFDARQIAV